MLCVLKAVPVRRKEIEACRRRRSKKATTTPFCVFGSLREKLCNGLSATARTVGNRANKRNRHEANTRTVGRRISQRGRPDRKGVGEGSRSCLNKHFLFRDPSLILGEFGENCLVKVHKWPAHTVSAARGAACGGACRNPIPKREGRAAQCSHKSAGTGRPVSRVPW